MRPMQRSWMPCRWRKPLGVSVSPESRGLARCPRRPHGLFAIPSAPPLRPNDGALRSYYSALKAGTPPPLATPSLSLLPPPPAHHCTTMHNPAQRHLHAAPATHCSLQISDNDSVAIRINVSTSSGDRLKLSIANAYTDTIGMRRRRHMRRVWCQRQVRIELAGLLRREARGGPGCLRSCRAACCAHRSHAFSTELRSIKSSSRTPAPPASISYPRCLESDSLD